MSEEQNCTCGGSNENCNRCFGSGSIHVGVPAPVPGSRSGGPAKDRSIGLGVPESFVRKASPGRAKKRRVRLRPMTCAFCGFQGSSDQIANHQANAHPNPQASMLKSASLAIQREAQLRKPSRPVEQTVSRSKVESDLRAKAVQAGPITPNSGSNRIGDGVRRTASRKVLERAAQFVPGTSICPDCKTAVKTARLDRHRLEKCPMLKQRIGKQAKREGSSSPSQGTDDSGFRNHPGRPYEMLEGLDRMDANRGMGYIARDNGQFGSSPLYDDFGDESGPERKY